MRGSLGIACGLACVLSACDLLNGGGGGGGIITDGGVTFSKGFAYVRRDDKNLYLVDDSTPDTVTRLTTGGGISGPSISRDGKRVAYALREQNESSLIVLTLATGQRNTVFRSTATERNLRAPVFSPAGDKLAFTYDIAPSSAVGLVSLDGSGFVRVAGNTTTQAASPSFLSDTALLVATGGVGLRLTQLERIDLGTMQIASITNTLGNEAQAVASRVVASPDGTRAAFDGLISTGVSRLFVIDLATRQVSMRLNEYMGEPNTNDSSPCWVDGQTVAYSSDSGGNDAVYRVSTTPGGTRRVLVPKAIEPWYSL
jgi:TolB protein